MVQDLCILYVCQDLDSDLSRQHYSWIFNSHMTYVSIKVWAREPDFKSLGQNFTFFFLLSTWHWDPISSPNINVSSLFFFFEWLLLGRGVVGSNPHNPFNFFLFLLVYFELTMRLWDQTPTASLYFSFILLLKSA